MSLMDQLNHLCLPRKWPRLPDKLMLRHDLLCGLRGPDPTGVPSIDECLAILKEHITRRIRAICYGIEPGQVEVLFDYENKPMTEAEWLEVEQVVKELIDNTRPIHPGVQHFVQHLRFAVLASLEHPIWGGQASRFTGRFMRH